LLASGATTYAQVLEPDNPSAKIKYINTYPNPATEIVNFKFQKGNSRSYSIQIINSIGKRMYEAKNLPSFFTIDLKAERFYRGMYIYQLIDRNGYIIESGKIFVVN
jgi:Secretion system C-terminal sorting domain